MFNFGEGSSIPQGKEYQFMSGWIPATPGESIPSRSNLMPDDRQNELGRRNRYGLAPLPNGYEQLQNSVSFCFPFRSGQYFSQIDQQGRNWGSNASSAELQKLIPDSSRTLQGRNGSPNINLLNSWAMNFSASIASPNTTPTRGVSFFGGPSIPDMHYEVNRWGESSPGEQIFNNSTNCSSSSLLSINNSAQRHHYAFPLPWCNNNLNSLPGAAGNAASTVTTSQFTPVTPNQANKLDNIEDAARTNLSRAKNSSDESGKHQVFAISVIEEANNCSLDEILDDTVNKSPVGISIPLEEAKDFDQGSHEVIDLNKTPDQKPPKRKKHRPKVFDENKPKRTPKATSTKTNDSEENRTGKRKYVRKNHIQGLASQHPDSIENTRNHSAGKRKYARKEGLNESVILHPDPTEAAANPITEKEDYAQKKCPEEPATQHVDSVGMPTQSNSAKRKYAQKLDEDESVNQNRDFTIEVTHSSAQTAGKSCRRALNFDLESTTDHWLTAAAQKEEIQNKKRLDLSMGFEATKTNNGVFTMCETVLTSHIGKKNMLPEENQQSEAISKLTASTNQMPRNHVQCAENQAVAAHLGPTEDIQMNSSNVDARGTNGRLQHQNVEVGQLVFPTKTDHGRIQWVREMMPRNIAQSILTEGVAPNREYHHIQWEKPSPGHSPFLSQIFKVDEHPQHGSISGVGFLGSHKRKRIEEIQTNSFEMPDVSTGRGSRPLTSYATNTNATRTTQERKHEAVNSQHESNNSKTRDNDGCCYSMNNFSKPDLSMDRWSCNGRTEETKGTNLVHKVVSSTTIESCRTVRTPSKAGPCIQKDQQLSGKGQGTAGRHKFLDPIEQIIYQIDSLSINGKSNRIKEEEKNALVPYKGDGSIIPYSGFANIKKQKQRPKVNLDPETERVFKLLMGKEGIEGLEGTDKAKEQWWEDERKVFSSRVNSFIARMHLVQGDRRFSKWKGSVVDSVIGVFLTQNVSDHLSSSAFMSLAALFPPQSRQDKTCDEDVSNIMVEEANVCNPYDATKFEDKLLSTLQNSEIPRKSAKQHRESETGTGEAQSQRLEQEVLSSQDSFESSILQANAGGRSYSSSNLEARQPVNGCKHNINQRLSFTELLQLDNIVSSDEFHFLTGGSSQSCEASRCGHKLPEDTEYDQQRIMSEGIGSLNYPLASNQICNPNNPPVQGQAECIPTSNYLLCPNAKFEVPNLQAFKLYNEEKTSWQSNASNFREVKDANCTSKRAIIQEAESMGKTTSKASMRHLETSLKDPNELSSGKSIHAPCHSQLCYDSYLSIGNKTSQLESTSVIKPVNHADEMVERQNYQYQQISNFFRSVEEVFDVEERATSVARQTCLENNLFESDSKKEVSHTIQANNEAVKNTFKASKAKVKGVEKDAFDWDSLRKQVQENGIKERSEDTRDSLDYEELRCASIKRISEAIKERGMNNMLAERIKEFLNRLVSDHGSIDLEWLRDVPPDKAKDYLLSIRGLGLKSVECVRLLTLHHLAFPVDTNVGRIAVRLGWVPLQPLPESLQLHLLELYPILETVQKYLWPRLCKLDQRTLYELHYQMITFGKVFCTKSRPNCNACPMRAECRHFASAFASARLALPGPEERSITTRTFPYMANRYSSMVINPVMLPLPEANSFKRARSEIDCCVPIVEEPTTPDQQHTQVTESDIEDMFDEDPDEIPTIKLNVEEFTVSLQNFMQTSMELQEGDMSKALVALNPDDSSIPVPKLKNVNRLRTEHQVYELPDSHPLLQGMNRREPDDPSPYLLAIWTPGETANSIEPPKQQCQSHEHDKLCDEKTCSSCNSVREATLQTVRGTLLIPCRTAMRGSFPLNGTYFQVNEVFADHESSVEPINVPRVWIWNLPRRTVYFGTSVPTIFKGLSTGGIQYCFWKGFVCVRGFDQKTRAPRPLKARLHFPASKLAKTKNDKE